MTLLFEKRLPRRIGSLHGADAEVTDVNVDSVRAFLDRGRPVTSTWHTKYATLHSFYGYAVSRGSFPFHLFRSRSLNSRHVLFPIFTRMRNYGA